MNRHKSRSFTVILSLLLTVSLLCGCTRSAPRGETISETYTASSSEQAPSDISLNNDSAPEVQEARAAFDQFCDTLFRENMADSLLNLHYTLADPETYGITDYALNFGDFSLDILKEAADLQKEEKARLQAIPIELLTDDQQLTYRILEASYEAEDEFEGLELYYQPLAPTTGLQAQLPILMAEYIFYDRQDIDQYLTLLSTIDEYYQQILAFEQEKSKAGFFMTDDCVDTIVSDCDAYLLPPEQNFLASTFDERVDAMADLTDEEKAAYKSKNLEILASDFIPAYELLLNGLKELKGTCTNEKGLCFYPDGKRYYEYLVRSSTGTTYTTVDTLRDAIDRQIEYDLIAMSKILIDHDELGEQLDNYQFTYTDPTDILEHLKQAITNDFPLLEHTNYTAKYVPAALEQTLSPAFFLVPPMDRYEDCVIYINRGSLGTADDLYTTLAHEGYPGHLYQNVYFLSKCSSPLRKILSFNSYSEGWATYVEYYSYTTDNGLSPELGQLLAHNASATLALHALLDININYYGWEKDKVAEYLSQHFGISETSVVDQIYSYMLNSPVNYLNYYVGYLEILRMKERAELTLKNDFNLKEFHTFILDVGPAPFTVIQSYFEQWLKTR